MSTFASTSACFDSTLFDSDFPFPAPPADFDDSCTNDDSWLDGYGDDCSYYEDDATECQNAGVYVDDAQQVCCGCGGGQVPGCVDDLECVDSHPMKHVQTGWVILAKNMTSKNMTSMIMTPWT